MKILFLEVVNKKDSTIDAHTRNSFELKKILEEKKHTVYIEFIDTMKYFNKNDIDIIIVSYASFYANFNDMKRIIDNNKNAKLYWITNEYNLIPNGTLYKVFKERNAEIIANYERKSNDIKCFSKFHFLNLNLLLYDNYERKINKKYDLIYYGTYRPDREIYFKKYFKDETIMLSTSNKNFKKFIDLGCKPIFINKLKWTEKKETLSNFKYSLYIEDLHIHNNFNNLANRFYEALKTNTVILFDKNCINTLKKSEIDNFEIFIVKDIEDIKKIIKENKYEEFIKIQKEWKKIVELEKEKMINNFIKIIENKKEC